MQNIPRDLKVVRGCFVPHFGAFQYFDYKSIEPRLLAYFLTKIGDSTLVDYIQSGVDPYTAIVRGIYGENVTEEQRYRGKVLFLSLMYGGGVRTVMEQFSVDYNEAKAMIKRFDSAWPSVRELQAQCISRAAERGYIRTPWGRHLHPEQGFEHKLLNKLIQGSAADLMKGALVQCDELLTGYHSKMVSVIHDEIILDGPLEEVEQLHNPMEYAMTQADPITASISAIVPIQVDHEVATNSWAEKYSYQEFISTLQFTERKELATV